MATHYLLNPVVLHIVHCMKYLEHITFCELAVLWSVVISFNDVSGDVFFFNSGRCCEAVSVTR
jgi:hypothetical protein